MQKQTYNQTTSFNTQLARDLGIAAAIVFDELSFWSGKAQVDGGWFYKSYEDMMHRLPLSKYQISTAYKVLVSEGYIKQDLRKINGAPTLHFRMLKNLTFQSEKTSQSIESKKTEHSIYRTATINSISTQQDTSANAPSTHTLSGKSGSASDDRKSVENTPPPSPLPAEDLLKKVIAIVNPREKPTSDRIRNLRARMKDYSVEDILSAAKEFSKSSWHMKNRQMSVDNLLRPSKFGRWYNEAVLMKSQTDLFKPEETSKLPLVDMSNLNRVGVDEPI